MKRNSECLYGPDNDHHANNAKKQKIETPKETGNNNPEHECSFQVYLVIVSSDGDYGKLHSEERYDEIEIFNIYIHYGITVFDDEEDNFYINVRKYEFTTKKDMDNAIEMLDEMGASCIDYDHSKHKNYFTQTNSDIWKEKPLLHEYYRKEYATSDDTSGDSSN